MPRNFRPHTKMPHFYGLSNNHPDVLPEAQKDFPDAEIHAITHYLFQESRDYLAKSDKKLPPAPPAAGDAEQHRQEGRRLFTERGCLACHAHAGTEKEGKDRDGKPLPPVTGQATFGPDLSQLAAKLGVKPGDGHRPGDLESARRWLTQWIVDPKFHHPRTFMPVTHLTREEAAAVADWLLSQDSGWSMPEPTRLDVKPLEDMARLWLEKGMTRQEVNEVMQNHGFPAERLEHMRRQKPEPDEVKLAPDGNWENNLKWYVGKKAISQLGCFGCHEIPGFEGAKPIGTPLNDWGKKDPERLAFEDIAAFVDSHYQRVSLPKDTKDVHGHELHFLKEHSEEDQPEGKRSTYEEMLYRPKYAEGSFAPYEEFFHDSLTHHQREGFLYQKLREPRSYDYNRMRSWEDRLRMPQFQFARGEVKPKEGESKEQAQARDEAEAREAVMTFVLGLVAEPVPPRYVYEPGPDKLAEVKGRQVLEKFNCAGCHQLQPGIYDFNTKKPSTVVSDM